MRRVATVVAAAVLAAVVFSACGSSASAPVVGLPKKAHAPGSIVFAAAGPSTGLGVNNTDLLAATASGDIRDLTSSPAAESDATWSADGSHVVFTRQSTTGEENGAVASHLGLYTWAPGHGTPQQIASCATYCSQHDFAWSPDDRQLAFVSVGTEDVIEVMNADGSGRHTVCDAARCGQGLAMPVWSPDGRQLVFSNEGVVFEPLGPPPSAIWAAKTDGSGLKKLTQPHCNLADRHTQGCALDTAPSWSPDGRLIAFSRQSAAIGSPPRPVNPGLKVMRADGSHVHDVCDDCVPGTGRNGHYLPLAWAPDGKSIASPSLRAFRITTLARKTTRIRTCASSRCLYPAELTWSPSGKQLTFLSGDGGTSSAWVINRDGTAMHRVAIGALCCGLAWVGNVPPTGAKSMPPTPAAEQPRLSGTIAFDQPSSGTHSPIVLLSFDTSGIHVVPSIQGLQPSVSPDGRQIAFASRMASKNTNIYVADRNGKNVRRLTHFHKGAFQPVWSPDGRTIAFTIRQDESGGIGLVSAADGHARRLTADGSDPSWSPTGRELVFSRRLSAGIQPGAIFTINADGSGLRQITNLPGGQRSAVWSPDGKQIAFKWWTEAGTGLYVIRPDGTHLRRVTTAALPAGRPTWSPDGRYLAVISPYRAATDTPVLVIDAKTGQMSTVGRVPGDASDPTWSYR